MQRYAVLMAVAAVEASACAPPGKPQFCMHGDRSKAPPPEPPDTAERKKPMPKETGGPPGPEPTRYGDWEHKGRCTDF